MSHSEEAMAGVDLAESRISAAIKSPHTIAGLLPVYVGSRAAMATPDESGRRGLCR